MTNCSEPSNESEKQTALVTGAGRGIVRGSALELARSDARLMINDRPESLDVIPNRATSPTSQGLEETRSVFLTPRDLAGPVCGRLHAPLACRQYHPTAQAEDRTSVRHCDHRGR